jgi:hypothetical protein
MRKALWTALLLTGCGPSGNGGGIPWRGKGEDVKAVMAEAKAAGKPMMLYFSSDG